MRWITIVVAYKETDRVINWPGFNEKIAIPRCGNCYKKAPEIDIIYCFTKHDGYCAECLNKSFNDACEINKIVEKHKPATPEDAQEGSEG